MKDLNKVIPISLLLIVGGLVGCSESESIVSSIVIDPLSVTITEGTTQQYTANVLDDHDEVVSDEVIVWSSTDESVASIDAAGLATGLIQGTTTITASIGDVVASSPLSVEIQYPLGSMISRPITNPPTENASIDLFWADVEGLDVETVVANYYADSDGHDIWWDEYEGMEIDVSMKSVYTDEDIYFLYEWNDEADSKTRQAWFHNADTDTWQQMGKKIPDAFGNPPAYEDKFTVFWNMSINDFESAGCASLCHGSSMRTNGDGELADIWHWKRDRTAPVNQIDDKWLDNTNPNGRHSDTGTGAYSDNVQTLSIDGVDINAPAFWIPERTDYHWILQSEIDDGTAKAIVSLDADNNWVDEDGTVLVKSNFTYDSNFVIPSLMGIKPGTDSRGDVSAWHNWADGKWTLKVKRSRTTSTVDQDVQFTEIGVPYWFSIGVMNGAAIAHATPGGYSGTASPLFLGR